MRKPIKATVKKSTHWLEHVVQSFVLATCIHFVLSSYHYLNDGFEAAYDHVVAQTQDEQFIVFRFHPEITVELLSSLMFLKTWVATQTNALWTRVDILPKKSSGLDFSDKKNHWSNQKHTVTVWWHNGVTLTKNLLKLAWENTKVVFYKGIVFVYALPLLAISSLIGSIDGLIEREIRTQEMGRESSYLFHQFSKLSSKLISTLMMLYFILPLSLSMTFFLMPIAGLTCFLSAQTCRHLKKYL